MTTGFLKNAGMRGVLILLSGALVAACTPQKPADESAEQPAIGTQPAPVESPAPSPEIPVSPTPEPSASPSATPVPSPSATTTPTPTPSPSPSPTPNITPTPTPSASPSPSPSATPTPTPSATPTPTPTPLPSPSPSPTASPTPSLPPPNHPMNFGYYYQDGKYGDFFAETECYTNLYYAWARVGYESSTEDLDQNWLPRMQASLERAFKAGKKIHINLNLQEIGSKRLTPIDLVLDIAAPFWKNVSAIELADEPSWDKEEADKRAADLRQRLQKRGLAVPPLGVVLTEDQVLDEDRDNLVNSSGLDWIGIEAYVDPPGNKNPQKNIDRLKKYVEKAKKNVPANKGLVLVMMAYARNGAWTNIETLKALQIPAYELGYNDPRVISINMFSYGRASGTHDHPELRESHVQIGNAITGSTCK